MFALGFQREEMIKSRHAIDPTEGQPQLARHIDQQVIFQKAKGFLRRMQHFDQGILLILKTLKGAIHQLETRVAAGVGNLRLAGRARRFGFAACPHLLRLYRERRFFYRGRSGGGFIRRRACLGPFFEFSQRRHD
jgi:hypothetical protein